jgi:hypothetical protein
VSTALRLMTISEVLVGIALVSRFLLPTGLNVSFTLLWAHTSIGIPIRWFVPLFLITIAGICSGIALTKLGWSLIST